MVIEEGEFNPWKFEWYTGLTGGTFKKRWYTHKSSFKIWALSNTGLSKYIWRLKVHGHNFKIRWKIAAKASSYNTATKRCNLCTKEK